MIKYFNIHDLVKMKLETNIASKIDNALKHLRNFEEQSLDDKDIDIFIYDYSKCQKLKSSIVISDYYHYSNNYLDIPNEHLCFNFIDYPLIVYCDNFRVPVNLLIELILMNENYSLIHSAAVQYNGKIYLLPAYGGIGKTTLVSGVVYNGGKLLGDDMVIVKEREILSYPLDFSVYAYHLSILKIKDKKIINKFKKTKRLNKITNILRRYDSKLGKLLLLIINSMKQDYISIPPKMIFGESSIAEKGQIDEVYYLCKVENNLPEIMVERMNPNDLAEICTNILFQEWHESLSILYIYSGLSAFSLNSLFSKIENIFRCTLMHYQCYQLKIPNNLNNLTYQKQVISYLDNKDLEVRS